MTFLKSVATPLLCMASLHLLQPGLHAQESTDLLRLFKQFQEHSTTDAATKELIHLGKSDPQTRKYLARHLPEVIENRGNPQVWTNAVQVAGQLKIAEAVPALARWLDRNGGGTITLSGMMQLRNEPPARALVAIGDPSVPTLATVLRTGNLHQRETAAIALHRIGTPVAQRTLRDHAKVETDSNLRAFILTILGNS